MAEGLLVVGSEAPVFEAATEGGERVSLADFRGRGSVLLMFYPVDDTPGCTAQMCAARDEGAEYAAAGIVRFGVNPGDAASHQSFASKYTLDFPLIVDEGGAIASAYGVMRPDGYTGRATYLIGRDGRIAYAAAGAHGAAEILGAVGG
ncbi:MAG TPA: peroxiredoxin [Longimicrobium sp.]|nr:peroxiredoxin [Longimicrobium sp.]